jgi:hypothetical protein
MDFIGGRVPDDKVPVTPNNKLREEQGNRIYNGLPSKLMNELYDEFNQHGDIHQHIDSVGTLYLARACGVLMKNGWVKHEQ